MPEFKAEQAVVLASRPLGDRSWIITLLTREHGKLAGVFQKKQPPQTGTIVAARWQARLAEQLGRLYLEETDPFPVRYLDDRQRLACLSSLYALLDDFLPERQPYPDLYDCVFRFFDTLDSTDYLKAYILLECDLLRETGFGLDTSSCAGGGDATQLAYISPKTGRAVSRDKGAPYHHRLLILPRFIWQDAPADITDIQNGLTLTGYFLLRHSPRHRLPLLRNNLIPR